MTTQIPAGLIAGAGRVTARLAFVVAMTAVAPVAFPGVGRFLSAQPGPALVLEDRVVLREAPDHPVGQPVSLIPADDGSFLIADGYSNSVLHFDSRGRFLRNFGQRGEGPGEFEFVSYAGFVAGDVAGFGDDHAFELELFEVGSGAHIGAVKMSSLIEAYVVRGDTVWFVGIDTDSWTTLGSVALSDLLAAAAAGGGDGTILSPDRVGVPRTYTENDVVMGILSGVTFDVHEDASVVHQESNYDPESRQMRATFFVSSVRADGTRPCPDTFVPTSDAGLAELTLEGDRLHVLDQRLAGGGVQTVVRTFRIDPEDCTGGIR